MLAVNNQFIRQSHVVFLVNFLSPNLVGVLREVAKQVGKLDILVSVPMEANRQWAPDFGELPVVVQRTWTTRRVVSHPGGYEEELFVHLPVDTAFQLWRLKPDCIVSLEMGVRSALSSLYRHAWRRRTRHVVAVYGSERSEAGRGVLRRWLRRRLLAAADVVTYNGPSCQRYLLALGANPQRMLPWNYAVDPHKPYRGELRPFSANPLRLLTVTQLISRKGIAPAVQALSAWAEHRPELNIEWAIAGTGPLSADLERSPCSRNLRVVLLGHQQAEQLRDLYRDYSVHFFPTLGDEWGLVVDEALASGQLILGSVHSQAAETLIEPGKNGWLFDPEQPESIYKALDQLTSLDPECVPSMRQYARDTVAQRTHVQSAQQLVTAVARALES